MLTSDFDRNSAAGGAATAPGIRAHGRSDKAGVGEIAIVDDFPNGKYALAENPSTDPIEGFAGEINSLNRDSVSAQLAIAEVLHRAKQVLGESCAHLAERTGFSLATQSKYRTIHSRRLRFTPIIGDLPSSWTVLFELASLEDAEYEALLSSKKIRPDLKAKDIKEFLVRSAVRAPTDAAVNQDEPNIVVQNTESTHEVRFRPLATIRAA